MLHPTQTDIVLTDLLKGLSFYIHFHVINNYVKYKFYIETALLRQYGTYIPNEIPNFQPVQVTCRILENESISYRTFIIYISNYILQKLDAIKASEIIVEDNQNDDIVKIVEKEPGLICLDHI